MTPQRSSFIIRSSGLMAILALLAVPLREPAWITVILVAAVALVGLPHGALDYALGERALRPRLRQAWLTCFLAGYLSVAALTLACWLCWPAASLAGFLLITWWHFGEGFGDLAPHHSARNRTALSFVQGGVVILFPMLRHREEAASVFRAIVPASASSDAGALATHWAPLMNVVFAPLVGLCLAALWLGVVRVPKSDRTLAPVAIQLTTVAACFWLCHPLVAFGVYFCLWHSPLHFGEHWRELTQGIDRDWRRRTALQTAATSVATILLGAAVWPLLRAHLPPLDAAWTLLFAGLAALTVPHMILSTLCRHLPDSYRANHWASRDLAALAAN